MSQPQLFILWTDHVSVYNMKFGNCIMTVNEIFFLFLCKLWKYLRAIILIQICIAFCYKCHCATVSLKLSCICEVIYTLSIMISLLSINCHYMCVCCSTLCTSIQTISVCSIPVIHALSSHSYICVIKLDDLFSVYQTPYILYSGVLYTHFSIILGRNFLSSIVILWLIWGKTHCLYTCICDNGICTWSF